MTPSSLLPDTSENKAVPARDAGHGCQRPPPPSAALKQYMPGGRVNCESCFGTPTLYAASNPGQRQSRSTPLHQVVLRGTVIA